MTCSRYRWDIRVLARDPVCVMCQVRASLSDKWEYDLLANLGDDCCVCLFG